MGQFPATFCHAGHSSTSSFAFLAGCLKILTDVIRFQRIDCSRDRPLENLWGGEGNFRAAGIFFVIKFLV